MTTTHDAGNGWNVEIIDSEAMFVRYRGVDLVAVWLPCEAVREVDMASVTVPSVERVAEAAADPIDQMIEYGVADETDIDLAAHIRAIDARRQP